MKTYIDFLILVCLITCMSCDTPAQSGEWQEDLTELLRDIPGLSVAGTGANANIRIRGMAEYNGNGEPLFVINGREISGGYYRLYDQIDPEKVKSVRVLKLRTELLKYGQMGINGVIEIQTI